MKNKSRTIIMHNPTCFEYRKFTILIHKDCDTNQDVFELTKDGEEYGLYPKFIDAVLRIDEIYGN